MQIINKSTKEVLYVGEIIDLNLVLNASNDITLNAADYEVIYSVEELAQMVEQHIYSSYPQAKQNSDLADKMYFETTLKASSNYPTLEALIAKAVADFYTAQAAGKPVTTASLATPLAKVAGDEIGIEQLIKVGIRVKWVQDCKAAFATAVANVQAGKADNLTLPNYPL